MKVTLRSMLLILASLVLGGCGGEGRALLFIPVDFHPGESGVIYPGDEVEITLKEASISIEDIRLESPLTASNRANPEGLMAHPGHEGSGEVGGELLGTFTLDLLGGRQALGEASVYTGTYATASLGLAASPELLLRGDAWVGERLRPFDFEVALSGRVEGMEFEGEISGDGAAPSITLRVDVAHILSFGDWETEDSDGDGVLTLADGAFENTIPFGVLSTPSWGLDITFEEE